MKYRVRFHRLVKQDRKEAMPWYRSQRIGLELDFKTELLDGFVRLQQAPLSHGLAFPSIRFKCLHRFPYVIYFVIEKSDVRVLAVLHGRRDNEIVKQRQQNWPS